MSKASIYHCEQCGGLLATREEYRAGICARCQFDRDWRDMTIRAIRQTPKSQRQPTTTTTGTTTLPRGQREGV